VRLGFVPKPPFDHATPLVEVNSRLATVAL
jgi:hypothetical protein